VDLWKAYHASGDKEYLQLLVQYNEEDIVNLKPLMEYCYKRLKHEHFK
ncbi:ribonuclease H-like domain-containing protein, partial [Candidatus Woesearchaeota archaeon]|nr:ribonuclease H-like domain-containing protein [Candidatus Woesearchaeota archaeon]